MSLFDKLLDYSASDALPMHMPGHKRREIDGVLPYKIDITEIDGFDNLHNRQGVLKDLADRCADLRSAGCAFPLVGGSTLGILSAVYALTKPGDTVIIARGCHKAVYHACEIRNLNVGYIYPETDKNGIFLSITPESVEKAFEESPDTGLVIITSPTYEGVISDIKSISEIAHRHKAKLFVDAAHGAHLGYCDGFAADALSSGADVVVESLHKTLPALTQTAVLYAGDCGLYDGIENALDIFETSSPSYVLLASVDRCISLLENEKDKLFSQYAKALDAFDNAVKNLNILEIYSHNLPDGCFDYDRGKIVVLAENAGIPGSRLAEKLRNDFGIEVEAATGGYVICMTSVCDDESTLLRLAEALVKIDDGLKRCEGAETFNLSYPVPEVEMNLSEAAQGKGETIPLKDAAGRISMQYIYAYPPGIPVIAPGEKFTQDIIGCIERIEKSGTKCITAGSDNISEVKVLI